MRGSTSRDQRYITADAACMKVSDKNKEPSLTELLGEIRKGKNKTEHSLDCMEKKLDRYQKELKDYIDTNNNLVKGLRSDVSNMTAL